MAGETLDVAAIIDNKRKREKEENRAALLPVIETVIFCGENELPLRGDSDSGPLSLEKPLNKDGKFRALIRHRASHDVNLFNHVLNCPTNASYLSPDIQNEVIEICGQLVQQHVLLKLNQAECFSIIADETLDISGQEQLSVCFRYVTNEEHATLREDFISFFPITDLSADNIADKILNICNDLGVDLENKLIGQGYNGASTMSGIHKGVQARIQEKYPKAMYTHCSSHHLNLVLSDTLSVPIINNGLGVLKEVTQFFRHNAQAGNHLKQNIKQFCPESKKSRLLKLCETRFIERQDSLNSFVELIPAILPTLNELAESNRSFSTTASTLLSSMEKGSFIVSVLVCEYIFNLTLPLSAYLQDPQRDLTAAVRFCDDIVSRLKFIRAGSENETEFRKIFENAENMAEFILGIKIEVPRQSKIQTRRDNPPHSSPEEYFRRTVFVPAIDNLIANLQNRFDKNREFLCAIETILPQNCLPENTLLLDKLKLYYEDKVSESTLKSEYVLWCQKWNSIDKADRPTKLINILDSCNKSFYPTIRHLLCVLAVLPVSTCEAERSFFHNEESKNIFEK
ncbi:52 kDa repressor of the inhibitor of the protein kinase-like [Sceloporus undulatus]|uniref:52 kDa repressor of the inhibitor of the protein kinase-like n=1 Tax=Sceloporus undulatus TaxID=8520 RepID=UPI001C4D24AE|nr:52 kDa repressor of the inhibitor of the protein kinase-like [Sceloporus undulatus]